MRSLDIKRKIIDETKLLIKKNTSITIKDIAEACYVNIAAVNYHFGSKEQLLYIVIEEVINDLKKTLSETLFNEIGEDPIEELIEAFVSFTYSFAMENIGILNYLFLTRELHPESSSLLIQSFFSENEFTKLILDKIKVTIKSTNATEVYAKYMMLFSSFSFPLFIQISLSKSSNLQVGTFQDPEFRKFYIKNLVKMVQES